MLYDEVKKEYNKLVADDMAVNSEQGGTKEACLKGKVSIGIHGALEVFFNNAQEKPWVQHQAVLIQSTKI